MLKWEFVRKVLRTRNEHAIVFSLRDYCDIKVQFWHESMHDDYHVLGFN